LRYGQACFINFILRYLDFLNYSWSFWILSLEESV